jgi:hypothetical protein
MRKAWKVVGVVLLVLGIMGMFWGGLTFTKETHDAEIGPIEFSVKDRETIRIPLWAGVIMAVAGTVLLLAPVPKVRS